MDIIEARRLRAADRSLPGAETPSLFGDSDCMCAGDWTCLGCIRDHNRSLSQRRRIMVQIEAGE